MRIFRARWRPRRGARTLARTASASVWRACRAQRINLSPNSPPPLHPAQSHRTAPTHTTADVVWEWRSLHLERGLGAASSRLQRQHLYRRLLRRTTSLQHLRMGCFNLNAAIQQIIHFAVTQERVGLKRSERGARGGERETKQTDRQTDRQTDKQTGSPPTAKSHMHLSSSHTTHPRTTTRSSACASGTTTTAT